MTNALDRNYSRRTSWLKMCVLYYPLRHWIASIACYNQNDWASDEQQQQQQQRQNRNKTNEEETSSVLPRKLARLIVVPAKGFQ